MKDAILTWYKKRSIASLEQLALYIHLDQPFLFPDPKKVLKELQSESTTEESTEEKKESWQNENRSIDSYAVDEAVRGIG
jgi:hypothetical protein